MAGGKNKEFLNNPLAFLNRYCISIVDGNMTTGSNKVGFYADQERMLLKEFLGTPGKHQHPFNCYFLHALPDNLNNSIGFSYTPETLFFTSTLSGCQFLAYGRSRNSLTIEHNNFLSGEGTYDGSYDQHSDSAVSIRIHNGGMYDIEEDDLGNVVGIKDHSGWNFYFQKIARDKISSKKSITVTQIL